MKVFGKYEVIEELPAGPSGPVFRGRDRILQQEAVIKVFPIQGITPAATRRFFWDVQKTAKLTHPNIASIYDFGEQDETAYITMEPPEGEDLRHFMDRHAPRSLEAKIQIMIEICEGLAFAHDNELGHRDLKPSSIFIKSGTLKIFDLAIAPPGRGLASKSESDAFRMDTPLYMAPEQFRGLRGDARTDIFSACLIFYELLTGKYPLAGKDPASEIQNDRVPPVTELNPMLPSRLASLISRGLAKVPASRIQSAGEFATELKEISAEVSDLSWRLTQEVVDVHAKVLALQNALKSGPAEFQARLAEVDLSILERLTPEFTANIASELDYFSIVELQKETLSAFTQLDRIAQESKAAQETTTAAVSQTNATAETGPLVAAAAGATPAAGAVGSPESKNRTSATHKPLPTVEEKMSRLPPSTKAESTRREPVFLQSMMDESPKAPGYRLYIAIGMAVLAIAVARFLSRPAAPTVVLGTARTATNTLMRVDQRRIDNAHSLQAGQEVEFLNRLPEMDSNAFSEVRLKSGGSRGFVKNADLGDVNTGEGPVDLWFVSRLLTDGLSPAEKSSRLQQVEAVVSRYPANVSDDLRLKLAASHAQTAASLLKMAQSDIATGARYLQTIRAPNTYSVQIASVNATLEGLAASPPPPSPPRPHTDQFEQWYAEAARKVDSAESEAEFAEVVALTNQIINAHFRQAHGQELQQKAKEIRAKALKSIESIKTRSK